MRLIYPHMTKDWRGEKARPFVLFLGECGAVTVTQVKVELRTEHHCLALKAGITTNSF